MTSADFCAYLRLSVQFLRRAEVNVGVLMVGRGLEELIVGDDHKTRCACEYCA